VVIPSVYATNPRAQSLRLVRVPSDQNIRWWLSFPLAMDKRQELFILSISPRRIRGANTFYLRNQSRAQSLRLVRVPSDQNIRWWLSFPLSTDKRQEFFILSISSHHMEIWNSRRTFVVMSHHVRQLRKEMVGFWSWLELFWLWYSWSMLLLALLVYVIGNCYH